MSNSTSRSVRGRLFTTTLLAGFAFGATAFAQTAAGLGQTANGNAPAPAATPQGAQTGGQVSSGGVAESGQPNPNADTGAGSTVQEVVVTGSILRRKLSDTAEPITTVTAADLNNRGITTVTEGIQDIAAAGSSGLPNSFTAQGAFAAGAANVSLRGLTSNSTLTLVDGLRMTYYPLADDGTRNFVDLNTIPDVIVDRIETLKDGASAIYGADAIAGVVNVITKKTYEGVTVKAEAGASQQGGGDENNYQALIGHGDLARDGYNVYVGIEYEHDDPLYNRERGYPYNTSDLSSSCGVSLVDGSRTCRANGISNGLQFDNSFLGVGANIVPIVREVNAATNVPFGDYQLLNPAGGCGALRSVTISPAQATAGGAVGITMPETFCQQDAVHDYDEISPDDKRFSASFRATKQLWGDAQAYLAGTYYQNDVLSRSTAATIRDQSSPGPNGLPPYLTAGTPGITLPVYVCASGVNCSAANGTLNPNDPFAAAGDPASIRYTFGDIPRYSEQFSQTYRIASGLTGSFNAFGDWHYDLEGTFSQSDLRNTSAGDIYIAGLLQAVATGAYNFVNPALNTQATRNLISPDFEQLSSSRLGQLQASLQRDLINLPGGPLQLGISAAFRYESIYNPSGNPDDNGQTGRFFTLNGFGAIASRTTEGASFELDAPILKQIDIGIAGRYDNYSTGVDNFSPQATVRIKPFADWAPQFDKITLRGTYSQGFRIPSFAEGNAFPTTGFTTASISGEVDAATLAAFEAAHSVNGAYDKYGQSYSVGLTELANPNLKPERSSNFTAGFVFDPIRQLSFSFDYYRITKRDVIEADTSHLADAIADYYSGTPLPTGYTAQPGIPDPNAPNALPTLGFVSYSFANLDQETTSGYDIGATARFDLPYGIRYTSTFDADYVLRLNLITPNGTQHYAGTLGPYINVSASGTPKFRANWTHTLAYGPASFSVTAYFTDGYQEYAEDEDGAGASCFTSGINAYYLDGTTPVVCKVKPFWDIDAHASYDITKRLQVYLNISNLFNKPAPLDPATYGGDNYNPAWANDGIYGRYFKVGLRASF